MKCKETAAILGSPSSERSALAVSGLAVEWRSSLWSRSDDKSDTVCPVTDREIPFFSGWIRWYREALLSPCFVGESTFLFSDRSENRQNAQNALREDLVS